MTRAAIYARMSTDKQSADSPADQIARCRDLSIGAAPKGGGCAPLHSLTSQRRRADAFHEAGHAVLGLHFGALPIVRVTLGDPQPRIEWDGSRSERRGTFDEVIVTLGGLAAEERATVEDARTGARQDLTEVARTLWRAGLIESPDDDAQFATLLEWARRAVVVHWPEIEAVAEALLAKGELSGGRSSCKPCGSRGAPDEAEAQGLDLDSLDTTKERLAQAAARKAEEPGPIMGDSA